MATGPLRADSKAAGALHNPDSRRIKMASRSRYTVSLLALAMVAFTAAAQTPGNKTARQSNTVVSAEKLSPAERSQMTRQFVRKWGAYVQTVYEIPVGTWAMRMVPNFVSSDSTNFRNALERNTFEGAIAELAGTGHRLSDERVINKLASASTAQAGSIGVQLLGSLSNDLVYTPVAPCRIIDTRNTAAGAIAANATRSFVAFGISSFSGQGGSATNCGVNPLAATAVAVNLTAVTPDGAGFATAYPFGTTRPLAASINYAAGAIVNNALIVQTPNPPAFADFTLYTFASSHYVADIVGYFAPPVATALQCVETANPAITIPAGGSASSRAPDCATGYTHTDTSCESSDPSMSLVSIKDGLCRVRNNSASVHSVTATRTCCRVPGR